MRLSSIEIQNHSRIQNFRVDVRRHAVIVGANDVGKTSVLRLLNLLLGTSTAGLYQALSGDDLRAKHEPLLVDVRLTEFRDEERTLFPVEISVGADGVSEAMSVQLRVELDPSDGEEVLIQRWFPESGHTRAPTREQIAAFGWRYMKSTRAGSTSLLDGPGSAVGTLLASTGVGKNNDPLVKLLKAFNDELAQEKPIKALLRAVADHLSRSMPRDMSPEDLTVQSTADPDKDVLDNVSLFLRRDERAVPLAEQSDGLRQLTAMTLFDLAQGEANIIAIDEPELNLHPASQRTIAGLLSGEGNQKVIVTHSPYIVHKFEPSEVISLDHSGHAHQVPQAALTAVEKQRVSWWSPSLLEALTSRYVIAVEGIADRIVVEGAARAVGMDLDRIGAVVLELGGAGNFPHVHKLLGKHGFGVTLLGLVDDAESPPWIGAIGGKPRDVVDKTIFISKIDLEDEYCRGLTVPVAAKALVDGKVCQLKAILDSAGVASIDDVDPESLAKYCRGQKVEAASAIAASLTKESARLVNSTTKLLDALSVMELL